MGQSSIIKKPVGFEVAYWVAFLALLGSVVFSWRVVTSGAVLLIVIISVCEKIFFLTRRARRSADDATNTDASNQKVSFNDQPVSRRDRRASPRPPRSILNFLVTACLYSALYFLVSLYHNDLNSPALHLKSGILAFPLAIYLSDFINKNTGALLLHAFATLLAMAFIYCLAFAAIDYFNTKDTTRFFYHEFVSPIRGHAVYISIYCFISIAFLMESVRERKWILPKKLHALLSLILILFLVLLASKLVIAFFSFYLLYFIYSLFKNHRRKKQFATILVLLAVVNVALIFSTDNPVKARFADLRGKLTVADSSNPSEYLNGLQFRLLQWRLVPEILTEKNKWMRGVGLSNAQASLNEKYVARNMYQGDGKEDRGYLLYNSHNQFLQELLQMGLGGLLMFILLCVALVGLFVKRRTVLMGMTVLLILVYSFVESLLETQYGIFIFCFLPFLIFLTAVPTKAQRRHGAHGNSIISSR